ncbi:MAG: bifunctional glutamate--cysteine ligase GshA/glutathione synthetase GshB [Victivallales bacterium]|nr:bifunctional glutamate--cysteine ligase GshA/glutathione synthetase GshB [Victivallales bacterium]
MLTKYSGCTLGCDKFLNEIKNHGLYSLLFQGNFGIERENLRVDSQGKLTKTKHPGIFGGKLDNPYITVDFAESQIELVTPVFQKIKSVHSFLENLHDIVSVELKDEYLWPQSTPPYLKSENDIKIADFSKEKAGIEAMEYRKHLQNIYGKKKQILSGIHFNFSFNENFLRKSYELTKQKQTYGEFKNGVYLKTARNYTKYRWLIVYLLGASPAAHKSYLNECKANFEKLNDSYSLKYGVSLRHTACGYKNKEEFFVPMNSLENYIDGIKKLISENKIIDAREYYSPIRLKGKDNKNLLDSLEKDGIQYLEIRTIDLNPYDKTGFDCRDMYFLHLFLIFCLLKKCDGKKDCIFFEEDSINANLNQEVVAASGHTRLRIMDKNGDKDAEVWANEILNEMEFIISAGDNINENYTESIKFQRKKIKYPENTYSCRLIQDIKKSSFIKFHLQKAQEYLNISRKYQFSLKGYTDMELSTQILIKAAIKRGISFEVLDRKDNIVRFKKHGRIEIVRQATKTSLDTYISFEVMNSKLVSKLLMSEKGIKVAGGEVFYSKRQALEAYERFAGKPVVVKPNSENFGIGITIFKNSDYIEDDYRKAVEYAFRSGGPILVEDFISGEEYRFFVIDSKTAAVLKRIPANVTGDGKHMISELVEIKNNDPLRGKGYRTPLEKIEIDEAVKLYLALQDKSIDDIPEKNKIVYLRKNSNISTGGDSIDCTDSVPEYFKNKAASAAEAVGTEICGIDMIIYDLERRSSESYAVIEANYNPAIHIHTYPYQGRNRNIADIIINKLGF